MTKHMTQEAQARLKACCSQIVEVIDYHLPEVRQTWEIKDPNAFEERVFLTMYLEMIHAGFFNE